MLDIIIEVLIRILAWAVQLGAVILVAVILTMAVRGAEGLIRKKRGKFPPRFLVMCVLLCAVLAALAIEPPVVCPDHCESDLTPERREAVQSGASGVYSWNIPLVPVYIKITDIHSFVSAEKTECRVDYTVYYFCLGSQRMEYSTCDGYNSYPMFGS